MRRAPADPRALVLPAPDGVRLWALRLVPGPDDSDRALLVDDDRALLAALPPEHAQRLLARRALLRDVVAGLAGCPGEEVGPLRGPGPRTVTVADGRRWFASTSSAGGLGLLAVADHPVGVDLEPLPGPPDALLVSSALLPAPEHAWVRQDPADAGRRFLQTWVRKEAVVKCTGEGLGRDLRSFVVDASRSCGPVLDPGGQPLGMATVAVDLPGHAAALATAPSPAGAAG